MKAVVSITIDEEFVVHDIKIIEGEKGLFIAMPSRKACFISCSARMRNYSLTMRGAGSLRPLKQSLGAIKVLFAEIS